MIDRFLAGLAMFFVMALLLATCTLEPARAQGMGCATWELWSQLLQDKYGEQPIGGGEATAKSAVVVFVSPGGKTWTILAIGANGVVCALASGNDWDPGSLPQAGDGT